MSGVCAKTLIVMPMYKLASVRVRSFFFLCVAVTYGFVLLQLPDVDLKDFNNYLVYADSSWLIEVIARIFESGMIGLVLAGLSLPGWRRQALLGIVLGSGVLAWVLHLGRLVLGFVQWQS